MDYQAEHSTASHYEYVVDGRESFYDIKRCALQAMQSLNGWCSVQKAEFLIDLVLRTKPKTIVEIGVWGGKSLVPMAFALQANREGLIYGIDPWDADASLQYMVDECNRFSWRWADYGGVYRSLVQKIEEYGLFQRIELIPETSEKALLIVDIDILHIDGNHSEEASFFDVQKWVSFVRKGGFIIFDDLTWNEKGRYTTEKAVRWLDLNCFKLAEFSDSSVWGVWVK